MIELRQCLYIHLLLWNYYWWNKSDLVKAIFEMFLKKVCCSFSFYHCILCGWKEKWNMEPLFFSKLPLLIFGWPHLFYRKYLNFVSKAVQLGFQYYWRGAIGDCLFRKTICYLRVICNQQKQVCGKYQAFLFSQHRQTQLWFEANYCDY